MTRQGSELRRVGKALARLALIAGTEIVAARPLLAQPSVANAPVPVRAEPPLTRYSLENGLEVVLQEDHKQRLVALRMSYGVGSRDDPKGQSGLAHLVEHLTYRGSVHAADGQYGEQLGHAGATEWNGTTGPDRTSYFVTLPSRALPRALWFESERMAFTAQKFNSAILASEQRIVREEERLRATTLSALWDAVPGAIFGADHPYAIPTTHAAAVDTATLESARALFVSGYRPDNARLILIGDFDSGAVRSLIARYFGQVAAPGGGKHTPLSTTPWSAPAQRQQTLVRPSLTDAVIVGWRTPTGSLKLRAQLELLLAIAQHDLQERLIRRDGSVIALSAGLVPLALGSLSLVKARLPHHADLGAVGRELAGEFATLANTNLERPLKRARRQHRISCSEAWDSLSTRALIQEDMLGDLGRPITRSEYEQAIASVTAADLRALLPLFQEDRAVTVEGSNGQGEGPATTVRR